MMRAFLCEEWPFLTLHFGIRSIDCDLYTVQELQQYRRRLRELMTTKPRG